MYKGKLLMIVVLFLLFGAGYAQNAAPYAKGSVEITAGDAGSTTLHPDLYSQGNGMRITQSKIES